MKGTRTGFSISHKVTICKVSLELANNSISLDYGIVRKPSSVMAGTIFCPPSTVGIFLTCINPPWNEGEHLKTRRMRMPYDPMKNLDTRLNRLSYCQTGKTVCSVDEKVVNVASSISNQELSNNILFTA